MKKLMMLFLTLICSIGLSGCGGGDKYTGMWYKISYDGKIPQSIMLLKIENNKENYVLSASKVGYVYHGRTLGDQCVLKEAVSDNDKQWIATLNKETGMLEYRKNMGNGEIAYIEKDNTLLVDDEVFVRVENDKKLQEIKQQFFDELNKVSYNGNALDVDGDNINKISKECSIVEDLLKKQGEDNLKVLATTYSDDKNRSLSLVTPKNQQGNFSRLYFVLLDDEKRIDVTDMSTTSLAAKNNGISSLNYSLNIYNAPHDKDEKAGAWSENSHYMNFFIRNGYAYQGTKYMSGNTYNKFKPGMLTTKDAKGREIPVMEQIYVDYSNYIVDEGPVLLEKIMDSNLFIDKQYNFS